MWYVRIISRFLCLNQFSIMLEFKIPMKNAVDWYITCLHWYKLKISCSWHLSFSRSLLKFEDVRLNFAILKLTIGFKCKSQAISSWIYQFCHHRFEMQILSVSWTQNTWLSQLNVKLRSESLFSTLVKANESIISSDCVFT